ncbi:MAG: DUF2065 domain-containing protein [Pseudomonadota bacterium]
MDGNVVWMAPAFMLVLEGALPFISPRGWRRTFEQILKMSDGQIRFFGLCSMLIGLAAVALVFIFH